MVARLRRTALTVERCDCWSRNPADTDFPGLAGFGTGDLSTAVWPRAAGIDYAVRPHRADDAHRLEIDHLGQRGRLSVCRLGPDDQCSVLPTLARPRRRRCDRDHDIGQSRAEEPGDHGDLGTGGGDPAGAGFAAVFLWPRRCRARARTRHLAPLSPRGGTLTRPRFLQRRPILEDRRDDDY